MKKIVKCPLCGKLSLTRGEHYFRCCQMAWDIEKHQITSYDEGRYRVQTEPKVHIKSDPKSFKPIIEKLIRDELDKLKKQDMKRDELDDLFERMKERPDLRLCEGYSQESELFLTRSPTGFERRFGSSFYFNNYSPKISRIRHFDTV